MNNEKQKILPELRFPEFEKDGSWKEKKLGNVAEFIDSLHETPKQYVKEGYPMVRVADVNENGLELKGCLRVSEDVYNHFTKRYKPENGDLIFSRVGSCGETVLINFDEKICLGQNTVLLKAKENNLYLFFYLKSSLIQKQVKSNVVGSSHKTLSLKNTKNFDIYIPKNPKEQQKIGNCLSVLDKTITAETEKIDLLQEHKKGLLQQLFPADGETQPQYRFPEFLNKGNWSLKPFSKLFKIGSGRDYKHLDKGEIPVYGTGGYMLSVNDFLYDGKSACIGRKGTINRPIFLKGKFWTVDTLFYTHSFKDCTPEFVYLLFQNINWLNYNEAGGVPSLSKVIINKIEVYIPKPKEQQKIVHCLSSVDDLIESQTQKIKALKKHKKGLMQQLFPNVNELTV